MVTEYINNQSFEVIITNFQKYKREKTKYEILLKDILQTSKRRTLKNKEYQNETLNQYQSKHNNTLEFYKTHQEQLAFAFYTLSENIVNFTKFNIDVDDAIQEGVLICFEKIDRFDPSKGKAFNYMTTCILNHFRHLYRSSRNYNELKKKYFNHIQEQVETSYSRNGKERNKNLDKDINGDIM